MKFTYTLASALFALAGAIHSPDAAAYSQLIVFGDSLSDNGNLKALIGIPGASYYQGRFSNGPVAVEVMAKQLGLSLTDYAYGGAQTGRGNLIGSLLDGTGIQAQVEKFGSGLAAANQVADASALYVVWGGANDFLTGNAMRSQSTAVKAAAHLQDSIISLYQLGARDFFVPLLPDLGLTPSALHNEDPSGEYSAIATSGSVRFNSFLTDDLQELQGSLPGVNIQSFDTLSFFRTQVLVRAAASFNVTDACYSGSSAVPGTMCSNPDQYVFWDSVHPTAIEHDELGRAFAQAVVVPEPSSWLLLLVGAVSMVILGARQGAARQPPASEGVEHGWIRSVRVTPEQAA